MGVATPLNALRKIRDRLRPYRRCRPWGIVSHEYRFLYIPIPKVGNTSLKRQLAPILGREDLTTGPLAPLSDKSNFPGVGNWSRGDYPDYLTFTFVRNPFDRLVSCFSEKIKKEPIDDRWCEKGVARSFLNPGGRFYAGMPFAEFVEIVVATPDHAADKHYRSQVTFVHDSRGGFLPDFVGKLERMSEDFDTVRERLDLPVPALAHLNSSRRRKYTAYYDRDLERAVARRYARDFQSFGYPTSIEREE